MILRQPGLCPPGAEGAPRVWAHGQSENTQELTRNSRAYSVNGIEGGLLAAQFVSVNVCTWAVYCTASS